MKISLFEINGREKSFFEKELSEHELTFHKETLTLDNWEMAKDAQLISVFISSNLNRTLLEKLTKLKGIATRSTGTDHIDLDYCQERKIVVKSVPTYGVNTVAEHTFALILALSRKIIPSVEQTKKGNFSNQHLQGFDLAGKKLGIIGLGHIGSRVAEIANTFKMQVLVATRTKKPLPGVEFVDLPTLLSQADILSFHTPLTPETHHLLNQENIGLIKKGALLVNTARGGLIATEALVRALREGILAGAALDVLEEEQTIKEECQTLTEEYLELSSVKTLLLDHLLLDMENVIITPHNAFNSHEALREINLKTAENLSLIAKEAR